MPGKVERKPGRRIEGLSRVSRATHDGQKLLNASTAIVCRSRCLDESVLWEVDCIVSWWWRVDPDRHLRIRKHLRTGSRDLQYSGWITLVLHSTGCDREGRLENPIVNERFLAVLRLSSDVLYPRARSRVEQKSRL
jgi:hypothetical protein